MRDKCFDWDAMDRVRGIRCDNGELAYGYLVRRGIASMQGHVIETYIIDSGMWNGKDISRIARVVPDSVERCTGSPAYNSDHFIYEGDRVRSRYDPTYCFTIRYGQYRAWCELDQAWASSIGFYAEGRIGEECPVGELYSWAELTGQEGRK